MIPKRIHCSTTAELVNLARQGSKLKTHRDFDLEAGISAVLNPAENTALTEQARTMLDKLMLDIPSTRREFVSEVVGAFPNAPAYATGDPECMWLPYASEDEYQPIRIFIQVSCSQGIASDQPQLLIKRGVVLMALIIALSERRQISLVCYHASQDARNSRSSRAVHLVSWDVPTAPLIISQISTHLANPDVCREVAYCANSAVSGIHGNYWLDGHDPTNPNYDKMRHDLSANPDDIIISGLHLHDPMIIRPLEWLNEKIALTLNKENA